MLPGIHQHGALPKIVGKHLPWLFHLPWGAEHTNLSFVVIALLTGNYNTRLGFLQSGREFHIRIHADLKAQIKRQAI
jgi:hypothetical protein